LYLAFSFEISNCIGALAFLSSIRNLSTTSSAVALGAGSAPGFSLLIGPAGFTGADG